MVGGEARNKPCPCGSGAKLKRCCEGRKQVDYSIEIDFAEATEVRSITLRGDGKASLETSNGATPVAIRYLNGYDRIKGKKTLIEVPLSELNLKANSHFDQLSTYKTIYFIDTNTKIIENVSVSVSAIILGAVKRIDELTYQIRPIYTCILEAHNCIGSQEAFSITVLQSLIASGEGYSLSNKIAIVNDASLRNQRSINEREIPIYDEVFLLPNTNLIYASTDAGIDLLNRLLKMCDK